MGAAWDAGVQSLKQGNIGSGLTSMAEAGMRALTGAGALISQDANQTYKDQVRASLSDGSTGVGHALSVGIHDTVGFVAGVAGNLVGGAVAGIGSGGDLVGRQVNYGLDGLRHPGTPQGDSPVTQTVKALPGNVVHGFEAAKQDGTLAPMIGAQVVGLAMGGAGVMKGVSWLRDLKAAGGEAGGAAGEGGGAKGGGGGGSPYTPDTGGPTGGAGAVRTPTPAELRQQFPEEAKSGDAILEEQTASAGGRGFVQGSRAGTNTPPSAEKLAAAQAGADQALADLGRSPDEIAANKASAAAARPVDPAATPVARLTSDKSEDAPRQSVMATSGGKSLDAQLLGRTAFPTREQVETNARAVRASGEHDPALVQTRLTAARSQSTLEGLSQRLRDGTAANAVRDELNRTAPTTALRNAQVAQTIARLKQARMMPEGGEAQLDAHVKAVEAAQRQKDDVAHSGGPFQARLGGGDAPDGAPAREPVENGAQPAQSGSGSTGPHEDLWTPPTDSQRTTLANAAEQWRDRTRQAAEGQTEEGENAAAQGRARPAFDPDQALLDRWLGKVQAGIIEPSLANWEFVRNLMDPRTATEMRPREAAAAPAKGREANEARKKRDALATERYDAIEEERAAGPMPIERAQRAAAYVDDAQRMAVAAGLPRAEAIGLDLNRKLARQLERDGIDPRGYPDLQEAARFWRPAGQRPEPNVRQFMAEVVDDIGQRPLGQPAKPAEITPNVAASGIDVPADFPMDAVQGSLRELTRRQSSYYGAESTAAHEGARRPIAQTRLNGVIANHFAGTLSREAATAGVHGLELTRTLDAVTQELTKARPGDAPGIAQALTTARDAALRANEINPADVDALKTDAALREPGMLPQRPAVAGEPANPVLADPQVRDGINDVAEATKRLDDGIAAGDDVGALQQARGKTRDVVTAEVADRLGAVAGDRPLTPELGAELKEHADGAKAQAPDAGGVIDDAVDAALQKQAGEPTELPPAQTDDTAAPDPFHGVKSDEYFSIAQEKAAGRMRDEGAGRPFHAYFDPDRGGERAVIDAAQAYVSREAEDAPNSFGVRAYPIKTAEGMRMRVTGGRDKTLAAADGQTFPLEEGGIPDTNLLDARIDSAPPPDHGIPVAEALRNRAATPEETMARGDQALSEDGIAPDDERRAGAEPGRDPGLEARYRGPDDANRVASEEPPRTRGIAPPSPARAPSDAERSRLTALARLESRGVDADADAIREARALVQDRSGVGGGEVSDAEAAKVLRAAYDEIMPGETARRLGASAARAEWGRIIGGNSPAPSKRPQPVQVPPREVPYSAGEQGGRSAAPSAAGEAPGEARAPSKQLDRTEIGRSLRTLGLRKSDLEEALAEGGDVENAGQAYRLQGQHTSSLTRTQLDELRAGRDLTGALGYEMAEHVRSAASDLGDLHQGTLNYVLRQWWHDRGGHVPDLPNVTAIGIEKPVSSATAASIGDPAAASDIAATGEQTNATFSTTEPDPGKKKL